MTQENGVREIAGVEEFFPERSDAEIVAIPEARDYDPELFVGRVKELTAARRKIELVCRGELESAPFVHFVGPSKSGKSWLLEHITATGVVDAEEGEDIRQPVFIRLDFTDISLQVADGLNTSMIKAAVKQASKAAGLARVVTEEAETENEDIEGDLTESVRKLAGVAVPVFLLDNLDVLSAEQRTWFERVLVTPFWFVDEEGEAAGKDGPLYMSTSRRAMRAFGNFQAQRRVENLRLQPFGRDETWEQMRAYDLEDTHFSNLVYELSGGQPYATQVVASELLHLLGNQIPEDLNTSVFLERNRERIGKVLAQIAGALLEAPTETQQELAVLSVLRRWDSGVRLMREMFTQAIDADYGEETDSFFLDKTDEFKKMGIAYWDEVVGYLMDQGVRHILQTLIRLNDPALLAELHRMAADIYSTDLEIDSRYSLEYYYHKLSAASLSTSGSDILRDATDRLKSIYQGRLDEVPAFYTGLERDREIQDLEAQLGIVNALRENPFQQSWDL